MREGLSPRPLRHEAESVGGMEVGEDVLRGAEEIGRRTLEVVRNDGGGERLDEDMERREKLKRGIKIVIGGPPRSGKSVFTEALHKNLGNELTFLLGAAPDGEGKWLQEAYDDLVVVKWRHKGQFDDKWVEERRKRIMEWDEPLMLIDVGGVRSEENVRMIEGATHAIVISGDKEESEKWEEFFAEQKLEVVASLYSDHGGEEDTFEMGEDGVARGSVHCLKRGQPVAERPTIRRVAAMIADLVDKNDAYAEAHEERDMNPFEVNLLKEFGDLPHESEARELNWQGATMVRNTRKTLRVAIPMIYERVAKFDEQPVWLNGSMCSWEAMTYAAAFDEVDCADFRLRSGKYVSVKKLEASAELDSEWFVEPVKYEGDELGGLGELVEGRCILYITWRTRRISPFPRRIWRK